MKNQKHIAFTKAYHACQTRFMRYCAVLAYGRMEVEDLAQDVLLATYERFDQIKQKDQLIGYLIRTARNRSVDYWRKNRYQIELLEKHAEELLSSHLSPETALDVQLLYKALDLLSEKQRDAITLFDLCGFSIQEIADIQQSNSNTVKSHLKRGRKKLRQLLEEKPRSRWLLGILSGNNDQSLVLPAPASPTISVSLQTKVQAVSRFSSSLSASNLFQIPTQRFYQLSMATAIACLGLFTALIPQGTVTPVEVAAADQQIGTRTSMASLFTTASMLPVKIQPSIRPKPDKPLQVRNLKSSPIKLVSLAQSVSPVKSIPSPPPPVLSLLPTQPTLKVPAIDLRSKEPLNSVTPLKENPLKAVNNCNTDSIKIGGKDKSRVLELLRTLKQDGITRSRKAKVHFSFSDGSVIVNKQKVAPELQNKYLSILNQWGIRPCNELQLKFFSRGVDIRYQKSSRGGQVNSKAKIRVRF